MSQFIHLRVHSAYSLAEGAIKIKDLAKLCLKHKMPAVAITDSANLFGALEFSLACAEVGVQPIIGCQVNIRRPSDAHSTNDLPPDQLVLLAQTELGYTNLLKLVSKSYLENPPGDTPQISFDELQLYQEGLIALTGGPQGIIGRLLLENQKDTAEQTLLDLAKIFPNRLYIELLRHGLESEDKTEPHFIDLALKHSIPLVATNEAFFDGPDMFEAHDALLCVAASTVVEEENRRRLTPEHSYKTAEEMTELFSDIPEAILNTRVIAQRCHFMPKPRDPILPTYPTPEGLTEVEELKRKAEEGLNLRFATLPHLTPEEKKAYSERLHHELNIINNMGFPGYFLIVADFIQWAKSKGIPVGPGRGSGAGSLVAWSLTITDVDPIRFNLLFERFLNPERVSMPDFDIDFCQDRRDEVIAYVLQKYGADRVAHIITFGKLQARAVLRDVGRVLQMPYSQVDRISKLIPNNPANPVTLAEAIEMEPLLREARDTDPTVSNLMGIGLKLEGLYRHASTHAAGVVIGDRPLQELVPLYKDDRSELPATQFSMKYVEMAGLVKFDFLGLKTLTVIEKCCQLIRDKGIEIDISQIPLDDQKTFELLGRVETVGVFQVESAGMRDVLRKLRPDRFEDLIALVALYRPGPMDDIPRYLACKHGEETVSYLHPLLKPILESTYGVMVYQEQVMKIAQSLGGYTLGAADLLRRAMGKKIKSEMDAQRALFVEGALKNDIKEDIASQIFDQMAKFAGYGFNKSHAAPYALLTYQTAYLKANHPLEFFAASMTLELTNTDKLNIFRQEMERLKIPLFLPDINASGVYFNVESNGVRYALSAIKGIGEQGMKSIVNERDAKGPFKDLTDFTSRLDPRAINKRLLESLVASGTFDNLNSNRQQIFLSIEQILKQATLASTERTSQQSSLFGRIANTQPVTLSLAKTSDWGTLERLQREFDALGFFLSSHPLTIYGNSLNRLGVSSSTALVDQSHGSTLKVAGIVLVKQERTTKNGQKFAFVRLSDAYGVFEVAVFSEVFSKVREHLNPGTPLLAVVTIRHEGDGYRLTAQEVSLLDDALKTRAQTLKLALDKTADPILIKQVLDNSSEGPCKILLELSLSDEMPKVVVQPSRRFSITADIRSRLLSLPGVQGIDEV